MENDLKPLGMTLRQLLSCVSFENIVPVILSDPGAGLTLAQYKQAFDILLHTEGYPDGEWDIEIRRLSESNRQLSAHQLEGNPWELFIDRDIFLEEGPQVSPEAIVYAILWHLTFYGFDPESKADTYHDMMSSDCKGTFFGRQAFLTEVKRDWALGNKKIREEIMESVREWEKEGCRQYCLGEAEWKYIEHHRSHCNGPKLKRDARLARRIRTLERMDRCEHTISRLLEGQIDGSVSRESLSFLSRAEERWGCEFTSRAYDPEHRVQYITDLIEKYEAIPMERGVGKIAVRIASSKQNHITRREREILMDAVRKALGKTESALCIAYDDTLGDEISVLIVGEIKR